MAPPELMLLERSFGLVQNKALMLAAELGIADQLGHGPRTAEELARLVGADPDALNRMLAFLVSAGLLGRSNDGRYRNNAASDRLRRDHPASVRDWILFSGASWVWDAWNQLGHSVRTGGSGMARAHNMPFFDYVGHANPAAGDEFTRALAFFSRLHAPIVARTYDFSSVRRLCDVGGGSGILLAEVLKRYPDIEGVLFEVPAMLPAAREMLAAEGLADRCELVGGDFFQSVPGGCDHYMMQVVLHDWDDNACAQILGNVRKVMPPHAKVLVIEAVLEPGSERDNWTLQATDLMMLALTGSGRERTKEQFAAVFQAAGLSLSRDLTLPSLSHLFELTARAS
ncbi:MAG: acetylserotonin O-methyltransferase [Candidatus Dormibacteraeota bacterium]|nr:acetylserotonin O-methyltransferase [Candidatus Dormibacteraeota bacterium]